MCAMTVWSVLKLNFHGLFSEYRYLKEINLPNNLGTEKYKTDICWLEKIIFIENFPGR